MVLGLIEPRAAGDPEVVGFHFVQPLRQIWEAEGKYHQGEDSPALPAGLTCKLFEASSTSQPATE
jgi:hypothetical protein